MTVGRFFGFFLVVVLLFCAPANCQMGEYNPDQNGNPVVVSQPPPEPVPPTPPHIDNYWPWLWLIGAVAIIALILAIIALAIRTRRQRQQATEVKTSETTLRKDVAEPTRRLIPTEVARPSAPATEAAQQATPATGVEQPAATVTAKPARVIELRFPEKPIQVALVHDKTTVAASPEKVTLNPGQKQQFEASVAPATAPQDVVWTKDSLVGELTDTGLYTAPTDPAITNVEHDVVVRATSKADPTRFGAARIHINRAAIALASLLVCVGLAYGQPGVLRPGAFPPGSTAVTSVLTDPVTDFSRVTITGCRVIIPGVTCAIDHVMGAHQVMVRITVANNVTNIWNGEFRLLFANGYKPYPKAFATGSAREIATAQLAPYVNPAPAPSAPPAPRYLPGRDSAARSQASQAIATTRSLAERMDRLEARMAAQPANPPAQYIPQQQYAPTQQFQQAQSAPGSTAAPAASANSVQAIAERLDQLQRIAVEDRNRLNELTARMGGVQNQVLQVQESAIKTNQAVVQGLEVTAGLAIRATRNKKERCEAIAALSRAGVATANPQAAGCK